LFRSSSVNIWPLRPMARSKSEANHYSNSASDIRFFRHPTAGLGQSHPWPFSSPFRFAASSPAILMPARRQVPGAEDRPEDRPAQFGARGVRDLELCEGSEMQSNAVLTLRRAVVSIPHSLIWARSR
jgi:hypothetical protein